ncbi:MAG TPA: glycosyltransferase family 4 protein [Candidatus Binatia bacterium]
MKIALVHKRLDLKGGTERDLFETAVGLHAAGHQVHLFCSQYDVPIPPGIVAHRVLAAPLGRTIRLWSFALNAQKATRQSGCDFIVNFGRLLDADLLRCGGGTHRAFLMRMATDGGMGRRSWQSISAYHQSLLALEKRQFGSPQLKKIIAVSNSVKSDILANYPVPEEKVAVLYNGVDPHRFHPSNRFKHRSAVRDEWNIPFDAPLVLFVGNGFRRKGLDRLISVWSSPQLSDSYLLVVGTDARLDRYRAWANSVAPGKVRFAGRQGNIESYYGAADLLALPSVQEAFGNVVLEALAGGLPVIVSRSVGAAELLAGQLLEGIIEQPENRRELRDKLVTLLDKSRNPALQHQARKIGESYSWENHFRKFDAILLGLCGGRLAARVS